MAENFLNIHTAQCSINFQNVKLRLDSVEIWSFYRHSDFSWYQILVDSIGPKVSFLAISEALNFEFLVNLGIESCSNLRKSKLRISKIATNDIFWPFEFAWFHVKSEWQKIIKFRQSQALPSHFESFWSIVDWWH